MNSTRRDFLMSSACAMGALSTMKTLAADSSSRDFSLRYIVGSCMYGYTDVGTVMSEVAKTGSSAIDLWPKVHGSQREQLDDMGKERFTALLNKHGVKLGCITQYKLGPFGLMDELKLAGRFGCQTMVTGGKGPRGLNGPELKAAVKEFVEKMKPTLDKAAKQGVTVAIENHGNNLIESADALKWLLEFRPSPHLGIALAPYHLPQDEKMLADLIRSLGDGLAMFYAWQHGEGCMTRMPKEKELQQMPGRGPLDFKPLVAALRDIRYKGWSEIFMHSTPRGTAILELPKDVTKEINRSRAYLDKCVAEI